MSTLLPRVVLVTRRTELEGLLARHSTRGQVEFFLASRGQTFDTVLARDATQAAAMASARTAVPADWAYTHVEREDLSRFLFFPNDIVVALGQDGLVANLAKYLDGQAVIGVAPSPELSEGILTPHAPKRLKELLLRAASGDVDISARTMITADVEGAGQLFALNELFIGHRSHQSARYELRHDGAQEFQSSSGVIVSTGTGLTGWAKSIMAATGQSYAFAPEAPSAAFFVREPWPSLHTGCNIRSGLLQQHQDLTIISRVNEGGAILADGVEQDFIGFDWGARVKIALADRRLRLVQ